MKRRTFVEAMLISLADAAAQKAGSTPIIDTHIHLFDPARPQGVPWPEKKDTVLYQPALPARYRDTASPLGITGAIEVECSPWLEDNQWVLDIAAGDPIIVGTVGNLEPGHPYFRKQLDRFQRNPLFRGIRYGNLWGRDLGEEISRPEFVSDLRVLAEAGLELDTANPNPALISSVVRLTDLVPSLRVVIDHLPHLDPPSESEARRTYLRDLHELGNRPHVFVKVSEVLRRVDHRVPEELTFYRPRLDELWDIFGPDRLLYGSDWPNSDQWGSYSLVLNLVREYFTSKGPAVAAKFFWQNSIAAYRWVKRTASQPQLSGD